MQNSFYGGQPGVSFIIVIAYESISEMVENFQKGPDYEAVHFDEHVLINTGENKNDPDNGKIFRRGYDYTNEMGGAIYVGTIVGPAGRAPMLEMTTIKDVKSKQAQEGYDYRYSEGSYAPFDNLVPGRDGEEYNDEIQWACCSIRDELSNDTIAYIGFIFPYTVIDYEASTVDPYYNRSNDTDNFTNENLVDRIDAGEHPYWEKWHISVPKGIKGDAFENFRVINASDNDGVETYDGQADDRANGREILVYDYYHFDKEEGGEPVTIYLGDYNMITGIIVNEDGTITITYTHDDNAAFDIKMISDVSINIGDTEGTGNQKVHVKYSTGEEEDIGEPLNYIMRMEMVDSNYHLLVWYSDPAKRQEIIDEGKSYVFDGEDGWLDLGSVKDESGILIGTNYEYDLPDEITQEVLDEIASLLDSTYPNGLQGTDLKGKVVTVGDGNTENKLVYAYDYDSNNWYYIGDLNGGNIKVNNAVLFDQDPMTKEDPLQEGGAWFVIEDLDKLAPTIITELPYQIGELCYDGTELTPEWTNYNANIMTISGVTSAIDVGIYIVTFTLVDGYIWPNGGNTLDVEWAIVELSYIAFYSADDSSLNFCSVGTIPAEGDTLLGKTVTTYYGSPLNTNSSSNSSIPWYSDRTKFISIIFDKSFTNASVKSTGLWFNGASNCTSISGLKYLNTSSVTKMLKMFDGCSGLTSLDVSNFDTSSVTNMSGMFQYCSGLTSLDVSNFDTFSVTDMSGMFQYCSGLTSLDVSNFDTSSVTDTSCMFLNCSGLTSLGVSNFDTSNVIEMTYMFQDCSGLTLLDVSNFNTSNVTSMLRMFSGCSGLTTIYSDDSKFATTKVTSGGNMFTNCSKLVGGNGTAYNSSNVTYTMAHVDTADNPGYFTLKINDIFGDNTPVQIQTAVSKGIAADLWSVGDAIAIELNGTVGIYTFDNETYYAFIIGFDHNKDLETEGKNSLTLGFSKMKDGTDIAFVDSEYFSQGQSAGFRIEISNTNSGGWESSYMRNTICPAFYNALPDEWQDVIGTITKYQDNIGGFFGTASSVTATDEQIFLLAEYEIDGETSEANPYEQNYQQQYSYYAAGNSKIKYRHSATSSACYWWSRSASYNSMNGFISINNEGSTNSTQCEESFGFAPAFTIVE